MTKTIDFPRSASHGIVHRTEHPPTGASIVKNRKPNGPLNTRKIRAVCHQCNNGWMSRLEAKVRPILEPLMRGEATYIAAGQQHTLALWIAMKCVIGEHGDRETAVTPAEYRLAIMNGEIPDEFRIYIGAHLAVPIGYVRTSHTVTKARNPALLQAALDEGFTKNIEQITFVIGRFFAHVNASFADIRYEDLVAENQFYAASRIHPMKVDKLQWAPIRPLSHSELNYISLSLKTVTEHPSATWV